MSSPGKPAPFISDPALDNLLAQAYAREIPAGARLLDDAALRDRLLALPAAADGELPGALEAALPAGEALQPRQRGIVQLAAQLLANWFAAPAVDAALAARLLAAARALVASALPADGWLGNAGHPARELLVALRRQALGWEDDAAGAAQAERLAGFLAAADGVRGAAAALDALRAWAGEEGARGERLAQRVAEAERGALRMRQARALAVRALNQMIASRQLSAPMYESLAGDWLAACQWILLHEGERSASWALARRLLSLLVWSLQPEAVEAGNRGKLHRVVADVADGMQELLKAVVPDDMVRERMLAVIEREHALRVTGQAGEAAPFPLLSSGDPVQDAGITVSQAMRETVAALAEGDWVLLRQEGKAQRVRLVLCLPEERQLLFVTRLGARAGLWSMDTFAWMLARGEAVSLAGLPAFEAVLAAEVARIGERHREAQQARLAELHAARERAAEEARERAAARDKALAEARALADARRQREQEAAAADAGDRQRARLLASSLTVGTWLEIPAADGRPQQRKLAVVLPATGKYILVAADGTDRVEWRRDELVAAIAGGRVRVLSRDARLDDALGRVLERGREGT